MNIAVSDFGPPGTGKTTFATKYVQRAAEKFGSDRVFVSSFTRAAAYELSGRELVGVKAATLHSHCWNGLGRPALAEAHISKAPAGGQSWNEAYPHWAVKQGADVDESVMEMGEGDGDYLRNEVSRLRGMLVPDDRFASPAVAAFARRWDDWKRQHELVDFNDLIELARSDLYYAPGDPAVGILDEAQDFTPLQLRLVRHWGSRMNHFILIGDDDQVLYQWAGATPEAFLEPELEAGRMTVLSQSYRVPRAVHARAQSWIERATVRYPKAYQPRDADGELLRTGATWSEPSRMVEGALRHAEAGRTVMLLASCGYMLIPALKMMRDEGIPFHNPYRKKAGHWNPLRTAQQGVLTAADRLMAFLRPQVDIWGKAARMWTEGEVVQFMEPLLAKEIIKYGLKGTIESGWKGSEREVTWEQLQAVFEPGVLDKLYEGDIDWYVGHVTATRRNAFAYPARVLRKRGAAALRERPKIVPGTIHCSPGDEPVLTTEGWVPISELDPDRHRLAGYHRKTNRFTWGRRPGPMGAPCQYGYSFERSARQYEGDLVVIETEESRTRVTPNHRVLARFSDAFMGKWVVYLMRRGNWWRVGICASAHRPYRSGGIGGRLATEQGDAGWILGVYETREEAVFAEACIQGEFGVPGLTFEASNSRLLVTAQLHEIHERTREAVGARAHALLSAYGTSAEWPLYTRAVPGNGTDKRNMRGIFTTEAGNLLPLSGYVDIPVVVPGFLSHEGSRLSPHCIPGRVTREYFVGEVYGLDVPPFHHYISGGAAVHNSVKGGEAQVVYLCPDLSNAGYDNWTRGPVGRDATRRLFYVGMTRASETLVYCSPVSSLSVTGL